MKKFSQALAIAGVAVAASVLLQACAGAEPSTQPTSAPASTSDAAWSKIEAAANAEGQVTWYAATPEASNLEVITEFNKKYPNIKVNETRLISGDITTRYTSEKQAGAASADVLYLGDSVLPDAHPEWFEKINAASMPVLANLTPELKKKVVQANYILTAASPMTITYNTDLIKKAPKTWKDLLTPAFAGKGGLSDPRASGSFAATYAALGDLLGDDYLVKLGKSGNNFFQSTATEVPLVGAGSDAFLAPTATSNSADIRSQGAPVKFVVVTPVLALPVNVAINSTAQHPNAAKVFTNFLVGKVAQSVYCHADNEAFLFDISGCTQAPIDTTIVDSAEGQQKLSKITGLLGLK